jgi:hypothetical protein
LKEHTYAGKKHLGNIDVTNQQQRFGFAQRTEPVEVPVNGKVWRWEGGAGAPSVDPIVARQRETS